MIELTVTFETPEGETYYKTVTAETPAGATKRLGDLLLDAGMHGEAVVAVERVRG